MNKARQLASALLAISGEWERARDEKMTDAQIIAEWEWDHDPIPKAFGGPDDAWNLTPRKRADHRSKTAKLDIPRIAKDKRIRRKLTTHELRMARKIAGRGDD